ncbi:hypothetical protein BDV27DRAFT_27429 [Aspergillus caelatus]|uniref:Uncharacterized protein n=1 Tax=Aspergillus caelatus TaxID=61420 RepID=A0A5N6ZXA9_9EURO|nr:uncharacterized protein BDV27DRAFT_27429 [Aspergillus caelatus]KAE8361549.1 hypothetical protein BDV27DRAFT_27429 [Aspergillus caelatus]
MLFTRSRRKSPVVRKWGSDEFKAVLPWITKLRQKNTPWKDIQRIWLKKFGIPRTVNALRGQWYRAQWGWVPQVGSETTPPADVETTAETESSDDLPQATSCSPQQPSRARRKSVWSVPSSPEPAPTPDSEDAQAPLAGVSTSQTLPSTTVEQRAARKSLSKNQENALKISLAFSKYWLHARAPCAGITLTQCPVCTQIYQQRRAKNRREKDAVPRPYGRIV